MVLTYKSGKGDKIHIFLDGEYSMTADKFFIASAGIRQNMQIDQSELEELTESVGKRRAFAKACDLLSIRDHSSTEIKRKLNQKGYGQFAEEAIAQLIDYGYLNDRQFAENFAEELISVKHYGKRRVISELYKKGIAKDIIDLVVENLNFEQNDLVELIKQKYSRFLGDEKGIRRTINSLLRKGYAFGEIKLAMEEVNSYVEGENEE